VSFANSAETALGEAIGRDTHSTLGMLDVTDRAMFSSNGWFQAGAIPGERTMHKKLILAAVAAFALLACILPATSRVAQAQPGARHPHYLRALADLRQARGLLDRLTPDERLDENQAAAVKAIDEAIRDIKAASIDDGKDLHDHLPIDPHIDSPNRFKQAQQALGAARRDVNEAEDNPETRELKHRTLDHLRVADSLVVAIMQHFNIH